MHVSLARTAKNAVPVHLVAASAARAFLAADRRRAGLGAAGFSGREGELMPLMAGTKIAAWVLGLGEGRDIFAAAALSEKLPDGVYRLGEVSPALVKADAVLAWLLGTYRFTRYKTAKKKTPRL